MHCVHQDTITRRLPPSLKKKVLFADVDQSSNDEDELQLVKYDEVRVFATLSRKFLRPRSGKCLTRLIKEKGSDDQRHGP